MPGLNNLNRLLRLLRFLLLGTLLALLTSCSTVRLGYSNAASLMYWWLDGYVDFQSSQKAGVKRDIEQFLQWHRQTQLPQYARFLAHMQGRVQGNPNQAEINADFKQAEQFSQALMQKAVPELTGLALSLNEAQIAFLSKKFDKNNEEFREKHMQDAPPEQQKKRFKKVMKEARDWFGSFSDEQEDNIRHYADKRPADYGFWMEERIARQQAILTLLRQLQQEKPARELAQALVLKAVQASFEHPPQPERRARFDAWSDTTADMVAAIIKDATPKQRAHAHKKLQGWIEDCQYFLAAK
jgi:hypothetical protein